MLLSFALRVPRRALRILKGCKMISNFKKASCVYSLLFFMLNAALGFNVASALTDDEAQTGEALYHQALQYRSENRLAEAEDALVQALTYEPTNADYQFELSNIYAALYDSLKNRSGSTQAADVLVRLQRSLERTLVFKPDHIPAHFNLGVVYKRIGRYEDARQEFREVLSLSPDLGAAWFQLGATYQQQGFWDEAEDAYGRARDLSYNKYEIDETLQELKSARELSEKSKARTLASSGLGSQDFLQRNSLDPFGGTQSLYGNAVGNNANQSANSAGVLPSLAAMMIQQMLSRKGQGDTQ